jgi:hypothetical protein
MLAGPLDLDELDKWVRVGWSVGVGRQTPTRTARARPSTQTVEALKPSAASTGGRSARARVSTRSFSICITAQTHI